MLINLHKVYHVSLCWERRSTSRLHPCTGSSSLLHHKTRQSAPPHSILPNSSNHCFTPDLQKLNLFSFLRLATSPKICWCFNHSTLFLYVQINIPHCPWPTSPSCVGGPRLKPHPGCCGQCYNHRHVKCSTSWQKRTIFMLFSRMAALILPPTVCKGPSSSALL